MEECRICTRENCKLRKEEVLWKWYRLSYKPMKVYNIVFWRDWCLWNSVPYILHVQSRAALMRFLHDTSDNNPFIDLWVVKAWVMKINIFLVYWYQGMPFLYLGFFFFLFFFVLIISCGPEKSPIRRMCNDIRYIIPWNVVLVHQLSRNFILILSIHTMIKKKKKAVKAMRCFWNAYTGTIHLWTLVHLGQVWHIFAC
jgi:hypothetical protein